MCSLPTCGKLIGTALLMCRRHWRLVPRDLQARVYLAWSRYQNGLMGLTELWAVQAEATRAVLAVEDAHDRPAGKPLSAIYRGQRRTDERGHVLAAWVWVDGDRLSPGRSLQIRTHSPSGFEWGYLGSGPSQLALALLLDATGSVALALEFYQRFKASHVQCFGDQWEVSALEICGAIEQFKREDATKAGQIRRCRRCGCTDWDCRHCVEILGHPCHWVEGETDLCSACAPGDPDYRLRCATEGGEL